jgi:hypothetical protein
MNDPMVLGGKLLSLLEETNVTATYKPALLMSIIDYATEMGDIDEIPVSRLAERVIELYWPQTLVHPSSGLVLSQNQKGSQAKAVKEIVNFRAKTGSFSTTLPECFRTGKDWDRLIRRVELSLAEMPIPRLQIPFEPFLYEFDWPWERQGSWRASSYDQSSRKIKLFPGTAKALVSLGTLLRPFIMRWWSEKAAALNYEEVEEARNMIEFEQFMFGRERVSLEKIAEGLLDLQAGRCFYCESSVGKNREIDHFVPWSQSGDDGLFNLVASCSKCNNSKRAILAGADFLEAIIDRNEARFKDMEGLATDRSWPADRQRSERITTSVYGTSPMERPIWIGRGSDPHTVPISSEIKRVQSLIGQLA